MISGVSPVLQAFLGTLLTWGLTALGAAVVFFVPTDPRYAALQQRLLDGSLGFAAGVMLAASFWSLLAPALEAAEEQGYGSFQWLPVATGFLLGGAFVWWAERMLPEDAGDLPSFMQARHPIDQTQHQIQSRSTSSSLSTGGSFQGLATAPASLSRNSRFDSRDDDDRTSAGMRHRFGRTADGFVSEDDGIPRSGRRGGPVSMYDSGGASREAELAAEELWRRRNAQERARSWRRTLMLLLAVTIHNFPEGLAVGVGFGGGGDFRRSVGLAWGIGMQNLPEGAVVSLPLARAGYSRWTAFLVGQLSGMVEPLGGVLGAYAVLWVRSILPYALGFAAGAMVYVVVDDLLPEAYESQLKASAAAASREWSLGPAGADSSVETGLSNGHDHHGSHNSPGGNSRLVSVGCMIGFTVMMILDVSLG